MRRVWVWLIGILLVAGASGLVLWKPTGGQASDQAYRLGTVDRGSITASVRAIGTLNPVTTVLVGSQLSGQVVEILADYNTPVKEGQVVARLYAEQIKSRRDAALADLAQARADLDIKRAQIEKARSSLLRAEAQAADLKAQRDRARAQLDEAQRNLERQAELTTRAVGTQAALEQARTQVEIQRANLASAEAQIASNQAEAAGLKADLVLAEAGVKSAEATVLQRQAKLRDIEIDLARTEIKSPVDGVVVKRDIELGQTVAASLSAPTLFTIAQDLSQIDIYANIDEADVGRLKEGQRVTFTVNAYPTRTFEGIVRMVRLAAQTVQNVVTYTAVIGVKNQDQALLPGMTANLQIITDEREDVLRIPNAALRFRPATMAAAEAGDGTPDGQPPRRRPRPHDEQTANEGRSTVPDAQGPRRPRSDQAPLTQEEGTRGRIYRVGHDGKPQPVPVRLGVTDGAYTEIIRGDLQEGAAIIVGAPRADASDEANSGGAGSNRRPRPPRMF
ncbi:efflux RND transporter periplasmic adaptor subunit [Microvirga arsenatis]|uniref:HlyD family efflux transporter periplasmic adaptor subunit n=1 Tax=Microvirga arsenatis TaxID=2692265 RepID=A0ABW9YUE6_9HYPH|nr:efflux RND transporter periplasmic adaptor subunit [Microvirga arsenatis]NBJ11897.1 HlyD family efflux transporter periplasmic adaptor subunit [Microvirga arsenatis]NBJ24009.1 HlyD family efflux transporter periplasmic adaptor subunit [Microvirga arsenatis]